MIATLSGPSWADQWVNCASNAGICKPDAPGKYILRYGSGGETSRFNYLELDSSQVASNALPSVACDNRVFGDSAWGVALEKRCQYIRDVTDVKAVTWTHCANEGADCTVPGDKPHRVRYGAKGVWVVKIESGKIPCNNGAFPDLVYSVGKSCEYEVAPFQIDGFDPNNFATCAQESQYCRPDLGKDLFIARFGTEGSWEYRLMVNENFLCVNQTFARDPKFGVGKNCQVAYLPPTLLYLRSSWREIGVCGGAGCGLSYSTTVGVTGSRSTTKTESWDYSVTGSIETEHGVDFEFYSGKAKVTLSHTGRTGAASSVQSTLLRSQAETVGATCSRDTLKKYSLWQFSVEANEVCYAGLGDCKSGIQTQSFLCSSKLTENYYPSCPPNDCTNDDCEGSCSP